METFINVILPILIILLAVAIGILLYKRLQKKFNKPLDLSPKQNSTPQVKLKDNYCTEEEMKFLEALHKSLPRDFISFPHVGVSKLIEPKGNMIDYKSIQGKYVDICVFLRKTMTPILVIDLYQQSPVAQQLKKFDDFTNNVLKAVKIPVIRKAIQNNYNSEELLVDVLDKVNSTIVTSLKDSILKNSVKK